MIAKAVGLALAAVLAASVPAFAQVRAASGDYGHRRSVGLGRAGPRADRRRRHHRSQDRTRGKRRQQPRDGSDPGGAEDRRDSRCRHPDLAPVAVSAERAVAAERAVQITGYRASNRVTIRVRDVTKVATTIDTLVAAGANEIGGINFMVSQESKALDEARGESDRGRTAQGGDLRQGRQRPHRRADQHQRGRIRRTGAAMRASFKANVGSASRAGRRDAAGFGECFVRDQAGQ